MNNKRQKGKLYVGFETSFNPVRMTIKAIIFALLLAGAVFSTVFVGLTYIYKRQTLLLPVEELINATKAALFHKIAFADYLDWLKKLAWWYAANLKLYFIIGVGAGVLTFFLMLWLFKKRSEKATATQHLRGARMITPKQLLKAIKKNRDETDIPIGGVKLPVNAEPKHMFIIGKPGTGKTVLMSGVINRLRERKSKGIIYDFKGDYLSHFYNPKTDIIFNPLDTRSLGWNVFNEIKTFMDVEAISHSLIPPMFGEQVFWGDAARDVFAGIIHYLIQNGGKSNRHIWEAVTADGKEITNWLKNTKGGERGYRYIEDASSKQALGVLAVLMQYVKSFEYMTNLSGDFSIMEWLNDNRPGFIFLTNYADIQDTLRPILSLFIDLMGRKLLSMKDAYDRRVFFLLDEFGTLQRLSTIIKLLTLSRSKGGSVWLGIQDIGQIDKIYTPDHRQSIINACSNSVMFAVADPVTAKFLSDKIGETEYIEVEETISMGVANNRDGLSLSPRKKIEKLILPSEIQSLKDLNCYVQTAGHPLTTTKLTLKPYEEINRMFEMRDDLNIESVMREQESVKEKASTLTKDRMALQRLKVAEKAKEVNSPEPAQPAREQDIENEISIDDDKDI